MTEFKKDKRGDVHKQDLQDLRRRSNERHNNRRIFYFSKIANSYNFIFVPFSSSQIPINSEQSMYR